MSDIKRVEFTGSRQLIKEGLKYKILRSNFFFKIEDPVKKWIAAILHITLAVLTFLKADPYIYKKEVSVQFGVQYDLEQKQILVPFYSRVNDSILFKYGRGSNSKSEQVEKLKLVVSMVKKDVPPGSMLKAKLISGGSNGTVKAKVTGPLIIDGDVLIEQGATLLGQGQSGQERLFVSFNKLIYPDGRYFDIQAAAHDISDKIMGLKGEKIGRNLLKLGAGVGLGFLAGFAGAQDDSTAVDNGRNTNRLKNQLYRGASSATQEQSKEFLQAVKDSTSIIEVKEGTSVWIVFDGGKL